MERRWTIRTKMRLNVEIAAEGGSHLQCATEDVGLGGVYVTPMVTGLVAGQNVEITFRLGATGATELHSLRAKVVRADEKGVGLMFREFDANSFRSLQRVMRQRNAVSA